MLYSYIHHSLIPQTLWWQGAYQLEIISKGSSAEEGGHDLRAAKNNFSEHYFQTITTLLIL